MLRKQADILKEITTVGAKAAQISRTDKVCEECKCVGVCPAECELMKTNKILGKITDLLVASADKAQEPKIPKVCKTCKCEYNEGECKCGKACIDTARKKICPMCKCKGKCPPECEKQKASIRCGNKCPEDC